MLVRVLSDRTYYRIWAFTGYLWGGSQEAEVGCRLIAESGGQFYDWVLQWGGSSPNPHY